MSKNAMAAAVTLCGVGLCMIGGALMMQGGQQAHAVAMNTMPAAASALASAATAQAGSEPTVVWYQALPMPPGISSAAPYYGDESIVVLRAWSDGTLEGRFVHVAIASSYDCETFPNMPRFRPFPYCNEGWHVISSPSQGFKAAADIDANERVDSADLAVLLSSWGDAPRAPFPASDCPLNLINP